MARFLIACACTVVAGFITFAVLRARGRRRSQVPELNQHPERLEQMLDETDDA
jgi:branched-subunit amino acid aminotransferase/4-amino-4-deoxychorismate lyase